MALTSPELIWPAWPAPAHVRAVATTSRGGLSTGHYAELNLGDHVDDDPARVAGNRRRLVKAAKLPADPCWLEQVHGTAGVEAVQRSVPPRADWSWTDQQAVVCAVMTADCLPLLLCDEAGRRVAAVHAGWRGLAAGVIERAVSSFVSAGFPAASVLVWLGPAISGPAYEVDSSVRAEFARSLPDCAAAFTSTRPGHWRLDLCAAARERLAAAGVTRVFGGDFCTYTDNRFYSHRRQSVCGRQASLIWLQSE